MVMKKKRLILNDIKPNIGIERWYCKQLTSIVADIKKDVNAVLAEQFKPQAKIEKMAADSATSLFTDEINFIKAKWNERVNRLASEIVSDLIKKVTSNYQTNINQQIKENNLSISFSITDFQKSQYEAVVQENISLIRTIPQRYLAKVETSVYQCVTSGYDLSGLSNELQKQYMITKRRANLIARDQSNKAHATTEQAKRMELGIKKAIWVHSNRGKEPRESHKHANGKEFDVKSGMLIDGEHILPGVKINCRCTSRSIIEF